MTKTLLAMALSSTLLAVPALAKDGSAYIELVAGAMMTDVFKIRELGDPVGSRAVLDTDMGYDFGGAFGHDFGGFRLESEVSYRRAGNNELDTPLDLIGEEDLGGSASALSVMLNGLTDIGSDGGLQFFAGGGAGMAKVRHRVSGDFGDGREPVFRGSSKDFAWQGIAGLRFLVGEKFDLGLRYRYFNVPNYSMVNRVDGLKYKTDWTSHRYLRR
ncbi:MAG: hypothetical protein FJX31_06410 [Alphaproteobacteria bacterium]|nr:hypothetical protein [Alphaproteobacteria bacterium]